MPLGDVTVVEFAGLGPVPFAGMVLAGLGADVIRLDRPGGPPIRDPMAGAVGRGKRSIAVDLKSATAVDVIHRLIEQVDVLIEGYRPGVMERLGLGPDRCFEANPRLVYGRMTGWGAEGPYASMAGHDINYIALSGALHAIGSAGGIAPPLNLVGDNGGGAMYLIAGVLAALHDRDRSGGTVVEAAMVDGAASLMSPFYEMASIGLWEDQREANLLDGYAPFYTTYPTSDGGWMAVGPLEPAFYRAMLDGLGLDHERLPAQYDRNGWPELRAAIGAAFAQRTRAEWEAVFTGTDACVTPVLSLADAPRHPHNVARDVFGGSHEHLLPGPAPRISGVKRQMLAPATEPGADTDRVLSELGYASDEIEALRRSGTVA